MSIHVEQVEVQEIPRVVTRPTYEFIETVIPKSTAYRLGDDGYFIVAPEQSLTPRFVTELRLPNLGNFDEYLEISYKLNELSSGFLWYETDDIHGWDFAWRLRLLLRPAGPLFAWDKVRVEEPPALIATPLKLTLASEEDLLACTALLMSIPPKQGGHTESAVKSCQDAHGIFAVKSKDDVVATATPVELPAGYVAMSPLVVSPDAQDKGIGTWTANALGSYFAQRDKTMLVSMANDNEAAFKGALDLKMRILKQAYIAQIGTF